MFTKDKWGWYRISLACMLPVVVWLTLLPISTRFTTPVIIFTSLGQVLALVGVVMFSLSFLLSARLPILEDYFGGMNKVYIAHHLLGGFAFIALMLHPLAITTSYAAISLKSAVTFLTPFSDMAVTYGVAALSILMTLLVITFFIPLPYHIWRKTHQFMGAVLFFAVLHVLTIPSDISMSPILRWYILGLLTLASLAYTFRVFLSRWLVKKHSYTVESVKMLNERVVEVKMSPLGKPLTFIPGQFVFISFIAANGMKENHPFSISSGQSDNLRLTIRALGDFTKKIQNITPGTTAQIEGPYGRFSYYFHEKKEQIWIAGGIGITPFMSMLRSLPVDSPRIDLYYVIRGKADAIYPDEIQEVVQKNKNVRLILHDSETQAKLDATLVAKTTERVTDKEIFACGPPAMMYKLRQQFKGMGVKSRNIHSEEFAIYET